MLFCQQCGAENTANARFCNMCGSQIASPGEPGGPLPAEGAATDKTSETLPGHDVSSDAKATSKTADPARTVHGHAGADLAIAPPSKASKKTKKKSSKKPASAKKAPASAKKAPTPAPEAPARERSEPPPAVAPYASDSLANAPSPMSPSQAGFDVSTMSLQAMGVRSRGTAWATILGAAALLIGLGAFGAWFLMQGEAETGDEVASVDEVEPPDDATDGAEEVVLGDPVPGGEDIPETVPGHPEPAPAGRRSGTRGRRSSASNGNGSAGSGNSGSGAGGSTGSGASGSGSTGSGSSGSGSSGSGSTGSEGSSGSEGGGSSGSEGGGSTGSEGGGSTGSEGGGSEGGGRNWEELEEELEPERDLEMELYANRIRSFIRSYYIRRASTCFDHASRNTQEMVRGTVVIGFEIAASGDVGDTSVARNTTGDDTVGTCLARQVDSWRLPAPPDGRAPLVMQMPFSQ
ncbi:MAG: AgmX/PglI C-terminal domain-containing protein [Sandaracinaceae bacterium]